MNVLCFRGAVRHTCLDRPTRLRRRDLIYVPLGLPTVAHGIVGKRERRLVRKRGFEPLRYCYRQPLKLVRLPVPPLPLGAIRCLKLDNT